MKKIKSVMVLTLILILGTSLLSGCALDVSKAKNMLEQTGLIDTPAEPDYTNITDNSELDAEGSKFPSYEGFYIKHNDLYYPLGFTTWCDDEDFAEKGYGDTDIASMEVSDIRFAMPTEYDTYLPTLYLDNKDSLVYYSENNVLDAYIFTKLWDLGYSVPITSFQETMAGYPYVTIDKQTEMDGEGVLLDCPARNEMLKQPVFQTDKDSDDAWASLRIFSVNGPEFNKNFIKDNIITGLTRNATYQFNGAFGSVDYQWSMDANYHYFMQGELYGEADYEASYDNLYTIPIPDYLTDGYYMLGNMTMFRLIKEGNGYNLLDNEHFNKKQLGLDTEYALNHGGRYDETYNTYYFADDTIATDDKHLYSSNKALNVYVTKVPGMLGFVEDETEGEEEEGEGDAMFSQGENTAKEGSEVLENTTEEETAITDMKTAVYQIAPRGDSVKLDNESMVKVVSDIDSSEIPCVVSYCYKDTEYPVSMSKNDKTKQYEYDAVVKASISSENNAYLIIRYPKEAKVTVSDIADGLKISYMENTDDLPETVAGLIKE